MGGAQSGHAGDQRRAALPAAGQGGGAGVGRIELIDTHLHLEEAGAGALLDEAAASGVSRVIAMGVDLESSRRAVRIAGAHPEVLAAVGQHPNSPGPLDLAAFEELAAGPRVVAVGEVGMDGLDGDRAPAATQEEWFHAMCDLALRARLPVSVHTREAAGPTLEVLAAHPGLSGVMHYFSLGWEWAERFLDLGLHLSFSGLVTRPSREELREVARRCPADRLLLETDSPYGVPHRQPPPNRPALLVEVARAVAVARGTTVEAVAELTSGNARRIFARLR